MEKNNYKIKITNLMYFKIFTYFKIKMKNGEIFYFYAEFEEIYKK
jgi:hypothetical protein